MIKKCNHFRTKHAMAWVGYRAKGGKIRGKRAYDQCLECGAVLTDDPVTEEDKR